MQLDSALSLHSFFLTLQMSTLALFEEKQVRRAWN
jgi:hypothetical protein